MSGKQIRCKICGELKKGVILNHYNLKLCLDCFSDFFKKRVESTIEKFKMFNKTDSLLIGLSGGKDSMSITKALKDLGYNIRAIHINAGIKDSSEKSESIVTEFCTKENIPLKIIKINQELKTTLEELSKISKKPICAVCGMLRRYFLNKEAKNEIVITGHTLNDEVAFILKNFIFWNEELLLRIYPVLQDREGFSKKVKPLCLITEQETILFCHINKIKFFDEPCPHKPEVYDVFKKIVDDLNHHFPGSIIGFYKTYLKKFKNLFNFNYQIELQRCIKCGYPTTMQICGICRLKEKLVQYRQ